MSKGNRQTARKPATKLPNLQKKLNRQKFQPQAPKQLKSPKK